MAHIGDAVFGRRVQPYPIMNHALMLDFDNPSFEPHNYALKSAAEFEEIFGRVKAEGLVYTAA